MNVYAVHMRPLVCGQYMFSECGVQSSSLCTCALTSILNMCTPKLKGLQLKGDELSCVPGSAYACARHV